MSNTQDKISSLATTESGSVPTVAVWGTGFDVRLFEGKQEMAEEILATGGAIIREAPMGTFPAPKNFPPRNLIISGYWSAGRRGQ